MNVPWTQILELVKDWNFVVPTTAWAGNELRKYTRGAKARSAAWGARGSETCLLVDLSTKRRDAGASYEVGPIEEARAVQLCAGVLVRTGMKVEQGTWREVTDIRRPTHYCVVGPLTRENLGMLGSLVPSLQLTPHGLRIGNQTYDTVVRAVGQGNVRAQRDYGLLARVTSPYQQGSEITLVLGRFPSSVRLAAVALDRLEKPVRTALKARGKAALVEGDASGGIVRYEVVAL